MKKTSDNDQVLLRLLCLAAFVEIPSLIFLIKRFRK